MAAEDRPESQATGARRRQPDAASRAALWRRLDDGIAVAVLEALPPELLGVRDAFHRYFRAAPRVPFALVPQAAEPTRLGLALSDEEAVERARRQVRGMQERLRGAYDFFVAVEGGLDRVVVDGEERYFVRSWTVITGSGGEAWGASGSLEIPSRALADLSGERLAAWGTRRSGGLISSLTGGAETRRVAVAESTFHAVCSLFYGLFDGHPWAGRLG
jgi:non-canonical (house-cleaning) NTP pyrophosphatase